MSSSAIYSVICASIPNRMARLSCTSVKWFWTVLALFVGAQIIVSSHYQIPRLSLTFPDISCEYLRSIDPRNSSDTKRNACHFSLQYSHTLSQLWQLCSSVDYNNIRGNRPCARTHFHWLFLFSSTFPWPLLNSLTFPWPLLNSLTFPWPLLNSLTIPGFPGEWPLCCFQLTRSILRRTAARYAVTGQTEMSSLKLPASRHRTTYKFLGE